MDVVATVKRPRGRPIGSGMYSDKPEYQTFREAKRRCTNPRRKDYKYYGGRGIEWHFESFKAFYDALGPRPEGYTLERKDVNGHYSADNCIWAPWDVQYKNKRKSLKVKSKPI